MALTSHLAKAMEKLIRKALVDHLERNSHITSDQHGFRAGHSTLSQLLAHTEAILERLEDGALVDVIYLDFAKAFDKVDHGVLLHACKNSGITGKVGLWLHQFLTGRKQYVSVNGVASSMIDVISGVPQGTVLAAILFLVMLNSIGDEVRSSNIGSYADDTKIMHKIKSLEDTKSLQQDLESVYKWAEKSNMCFNSDKFQLLRYGRNSELKACTGYVASNGNPIEESQCVKDLGVLMSSDGSFAKHIERTVQSATHIAGWVLRTFYSRDAGTMKTLLKSLILSKLDYCSPLIHPSSSALTIRLEQVQRAFTRRISGTQGMTYWDRLAYLKLFSVERRHERYIIIYMFKIKYGIVPNVNIEFRNNPRTGIYATIPQVKSSAPSFIKRMKYEAFSSVGPRLFNTLPHEIRTYMPPEEAIDKVGCLKNVLDKFLARLPDQPTVYGLSRAAPTNSISHQIVYKFD